MDTQEKLISHAWEITTGHSGTKLFLMFLAIMADEKGVCCETRKNIAHTLHMSKRSVSRHVVRLVKMGLIESKEVKLHSGKIGNSYHLNIPKILKDGKTVINPEF